MAPRDPEWYYYPGSGWQNMLFSVGYEFETPIPEITPEGAKPFPPTGYRQLDARTSFFYGVTGITPAMAMRLPGVGSTYLWTMVDANKQLFDGAKIYKVTLPNDIPPNVGLSTLVTTNRTISASARRDRSNDHQSRTTAQMGSGRRSRSRPIDFARTTRASPDRAPVHGR